MKKDNPNLQLRGKDDLTVARQVVLNQTQARPEHTVSVSGFQNETTLGIIGKDLFVYEYEYVTFMQ